MTASDLSMAMPMSISAPKGRVLCVDDEPNILRALGWLLQKEFEVVTAASGREGLERVKSDDFDVVISDQHMPEMSGIDFLREVKAQAPRAMRILLTGYSDRDAVLRSVNESEIFRYVTKPWDVAELPRIVAQAAEIARRQTEDGQWTAAGEMPMPAAGESKILVLDDDVRVHAAVELCAGDLAQVVHVTNIADAIHHLHDHSIGVIVAETRVGSVDLTRLICLLKQRCPQVVSVVLAEEAGADTVIRLVNQGQIFRFLPKPIKAALLRKTLQQALSRSYEIHRKPGQGYRHQVDNLPEEEMAFLHGQLQSAVSWRRTGVQPLSPPSLGTRMGGLLRRIFTDSRKHV